MKRLLFCNRPLYSGSAAAGEEESGSRFFRFRKCWSKWRTMRSKPLENSQVERQLAGSWVAVRIRSANVFEFVQHEGNEAICCRRSHHDEVY